MLEVVLATSARAEELVDLEGRQWRQGSDWRMRLAVGLQCPVCGAGVVAAIEHPLSARDAWRMLRQADHCLHQALEAPVEALATEVA